MQRTCTISSLLIKLSDFDGTFAFEPLLPASFRDSNEVLISFTAAKLSNDISEDLEFPYPSSALDIDLRVVRRPRPSLVRVLFFVDASKRETHRSSRDWKRAYLCFCMVQKLLIDDLIYKAAMVNTHWSILLDVVYSLQRYRETPSSESFSDRISGRYLSGRLVVLSVTDPDPGISFKRPMNQVWWQLVRIAGSVCNCARFYWSVSRSSIDLAVHEYGGWQSWYSKDRGRVELKHTQWLETSICELFVGTSLSLLRVCRRRLSRRSSSVWWMNSSRLCSFTARCRWFLTSSIPPWKTLHFDGIFDMHAANFTTTIRCFPKRKNLAGG